MLTPQDCDPTTLAFLQDTVNNLTKENQEHGGRVDQRAGVLLAFSGLLATYVSTEVVRPLQSGLDWRTGLPFAIGLLAVLLALLTAVFAVLAMRIRVVNTLNVRELLDVYAGQPLLDTRFDVLNTTGDIYLAQFDLVEAKSNNLRRAFLALVATIASTALAVTLNASLPEVTDHDHQDSTYHQPTHADAQPQPHR